MKIICLKHRNSLLVILLTLCCDWPAGFRVGSCRFPRSFGATTWLGRCTAYNNQRYISDCSFERFSAANIAVVMATVTDSLLKLIGLISRIVFS